MISTFDKIPDTAEELVKIKEENYLTTYEVINRVYELKREVREKVEIPPYKLKPKANNAKTPAELRALADEIEEWEKYEKKRKAAIRKSERSEADVSELIEDFVKIDSGLTTKVPEKYRDKIYRIAWDRGHGCGFSEVYNYLVELVEVFE